MFCPQISLGNAVFVKQSYIFLTEKFLRAFKILICYVTIQKIIIIWETRTAILLLGSFLRLPFLQHILFQVKFMILLEKPLGMA